jgi:ribosomal protein L12E/L44/L45/RPP1/RPP2
MNTRNEMESAFDDARSQALNVDWFTWQIAWHSARASAATACVACEGSPTAENNPCAVCGSAATVAEPSAANLEGLAKALLAPREIVRDADGWLDHPALPVCDEGVRFDALLGAFGLETYFRAMDGDISPEEYDRYYDEQGGCAVWTPTPPEGNGWKLIAIYDTEDGPYAMFAREKQPEPRKRRAKTAQQQAELSDPLDAERQQVNALFKRVEGESIEQHLQRFAEGMDAIQAAQQQAAPGADERVAFEAWPKVLGVGRDNEHPQNLVVYLGAVPTDGELRAIHDNLRAAQSGQQQAEPIAEIRHRNGHPYAAMRKAYDANGNTLAEGTLLYAGAQQAELGADEIRYDGLHEYAQANGLDYNELCRVVRAAQSGQRAGVAEDAIEAAAKKLAEDFDYPWEHMPAQGKDDFRAKVRSIAAMLAAPTQQQERSE